MSKDSGDNPLNLLDPIDTDMVNEPWLVAADRGSLLQRPTQADVEAVIKEGVNR